MRLGVVAEPPVLHHHKLEMDTQLPAEIVEKILQQLWFSDLSSAERILLMTTCPCLNSTWKSQFARIASITIHIPCLNYLLYLAGIVRTGKSLVYDRQYLRTGARTMICFLDLREWRVDIHSYRVWGIFFRMRNFVGLRTCFPSIQRLSFQTVFLPCLAYCLGGQPQVAHTDLSILFDHATGQPPSLGQHKVLINFVIHDPETTSFLSPPSDSWVTAGRWKLGTIDSLYFLLYAKLRRLPDRPKNESHPIPDHPFAIREKIKDGLHLHGREIRTSYNTVFHDHSLSEADDFWGVNRRLYIAGTSAPSEYAFFSQDHRLKHFVLNAGWGSFATHLYHRVNEAWLRYKVPDILGNYGKGVNPLCSLMHIRSLSLDAYMSRYYASRI
ncbi:hypothetical protein BT96DRAFT_989061 [Gymnopus androsaceus JB14]|uniref:F-box domain-containing protein n=1 Tax=Gymnopus androsaceus JB14 TaxID=1447944 RepID=A0A6A4I5Q6_9AGAR|nr:hypothetical protein BT96DRAFT_989061 [Gymnopus androsaceus JB14]